MGQCLDIDGNGIAPGTKVEIWDCNGFGGQQGYPNPTDRAVSIFNINTYTRNLRKG